MCMITYVPANIDIPWEGIENGAVFNDDGHGWAIASKEYGLEIGKSMDYDLAALTLAIAREKHGPNSLVMFHSRWATHGETSEFNVHPFRVDSEEMESEGTVMAHNGILAMQYHPTAGDPRSDTRIFGDEIASYMLGEAGIPSRRGGKALGAMIGGGNKLVFLTAKGGAPRVRIVNAHQGVFTNGVWYSNDGYKNQVYYGRRHWSKSDDLWDNYSGGYSGGYSGKATVIGNPPATTTRTSTDCEHCGESDSVDLSAGICLACDICIDCKQFLWEGCQCFLSAATLEAIRDKDESKAIEVWTGPLNPDYNPEATSNPAFSGAVELG